MTTFFHNCIEFHPKATETCSMNEVKSHELSALHFSIADFPICCILAAKGQCILSSQLPSHRTLPLTELGD